LSVKRGETTKGNAHDLFRAERQGEKGSVGQMVKDKEKIRQKTLLGPSRSWNGGAFANHERMTWEELNVIRTMKLQTDNTTAKMEGPDNGGGRE